MIMTFALEYPVHFLSEYRTELYEQYCSGGMELKNVLDAKSTFQSWTLFNLGRYGA